MACIARSSSKKKKKKKRKKTLYLYSFVPSVLISLFSPAFLSNGISSFELHILLYIFSFFFFYILVVSFIVIYLLFRSLIPSTFRSALLLFSLGNGSLILRFCYLASSSLKQGRTMVIFFFLFFFFLFFLNVRLILLCSS